MKLETILDAMLTVHREMLFEFGRYASAQEIKESKRYRQLHAFRARILRIFETNWRTAWEAASQRCGELMERNRSLCELHELEIAAKDARIADIEEHNTRLEEENKNYQEAFRTCPK